MGFEVNGPDLGVLTAAADLSANLFYGAIIDTSGNVNIATVAGQRIDGILYDKSKSGDPVRLKRDDVGQCIYGGTVTAGDPLCVAANGKFVTAVGAEFILGRALVSGVLNDIGTMMITNEGYAPALFHSEHIALANITAASMITNWVPGLPGNTKIIGLWAKVTIPATTGAKLATLTWNINAQPANAGNVATTGGALALTSANMTPKGAVVAASAITAANTFGPLDQISLVGSAVTAFVEGEIEVVSLFART